MLFEGKVPFHNCNPATLMNAFRHARKLIVFVFTILFAATMVAKEKVHPNILFAFADDWGWPHAGAYGDPVVKTPTFDRLAEEGALFHHAYVSSPSCTPSAQVAATKDSNAYFAIDWYA